MQDPKCKKPTQYNENTPVASNSYGDPMLSGPQTQLSSYEAPSIQQGSPSVSAPSNLQLPDTDVASIPQAGTQSASPQQFTQFVETGPLQVPQASPPQLYQQPVFTDQPISVAGLQQTPPVNMQNAPTFAIDQTGFASPFQTTSVQPQIVQPPFSARAVEAIPWQNIRIIS